MSNILRMRDLTEAADPGVWVGLEQYQTRLPNETDVGFVVQKTKRGLWRAAVRGYDNGQQFKAIRDSNGRLAAEVNNQTYPVFEAYHEVHSVGSQEGERYIEAVKAPETATGLLIQLLETPKQGVWDVTAPMEDNVYTPFAQLVIVDGVALLNWGDETGFEGSANVGEGPRKYAGQIDAEVVSDGVNFYVKPKDKQFRGLSASAIADRVAYFPTRVTASNRPAAEQDTLSEPITSRIPTGYEQLFGG